MRKHGREAWAKWRGLVAEQQRSGNSVAAFCRARAISAPQFFAWKKRLRQAATAQFVAVQVAAEAEPAARSAGESRPLEIRLGGGRSVLVEPGFDGGHLRAVLAVLEGGG